MVKNRSALAHTAAAGGLICTAAVLAQPLQPDTATGSEPLNALKKRVVDGPDRDYTLDLGGIRFDPIREGEPALPIGWDRNARGAGDGDKADLHLCQLTGPTKDEWIEQIENDGFKIVQYIYPHTYVLWGKQNDRAAAAPRPYVRWTGDFAPAYRVRPEFRNLRADMTAQVRVLMYRGTDTTKVVRDISDLGGRNTGRKVLNKTWELATFDLPGDQMMNAANIAGVYSISCQPTDGGLRGEMSNQINVNNITPSNAAIPGYEAWLASVGLDGSGVIMANVDSGINDNHPDLVNRMLPCVGSTCGGATQSTHGSHTAGIMAGDGSSGVTANGGFLRGLGVAPGAMMVEQLYSPTFTQPGGMLTLIEQSWDNGAVMSGNSWGPAGTPQGYDDDTMQVDIGVRDADPDTPGNQPFTYVLSFMNGNGGTMTQGSPDEAKNLFNIGSTKMQNSGSGSQILDIDDLSANTAHGPARDGRIIPHMVAPGCFVDSTATGSGYTLLCGTSMASPHVTGGVALFFEYYRSMFSVDPSPALVKAAFLPVAHDLAGNLDADGGVLGHPFDAKQGWGRMNLEAVVAPDDPNGVRYFDNPVVFDNTGEEWSQVLSPLDTDQPVRIMLVWTDAPGHGLGGTTPAWNNDLDLIVEAGPDTYRGNNFGSNGFSTTGGSADFRNNTEGVFLGPNPPGAFTVRVVATDINSDAIPNEGDATDQDFALVCYNCAVEPGFALSPAPADAAICAPDDAVYTIDVEQVLGFAEDVTLTASGNPAGTTVAFAPNPVTPGNSATMTISNTGSAAAGDYTVDITGTSTSLTRDASVGFSLDAGVPGMATLTSPADGAMNTSTVPMLMWNAAAGAGAYQVEVAADAAFNTIVYSASEPGTLHAVASPLDTDSTYYWRVRGTNACGNGTDSMTFSFTTLDVPEILLVDDDDNAPNVRGTYESMLDSMGLMYDVWDTNNTDNEPGLQDLAAYKIVIWFTGDEFGGSCGPGPGGEAALSQWLDAGGCLLISSQDYFFDRGLTMFMQDYLGVASATSDVSQGSATGSGTVFSGLGPYTLSYPFTNWSDTVNPNGAGETAFTGTAGNSAVSKDGGDYRTAFLGYPMEALPSDVERAEVMQRMLDWCAELNVQPCPADCTPPGGNGVVNVDDLLAVVNAISTQDLDCDVAPDNGDGTFGNGLINFDDLIAVVNAFGACP